MQLFGVRKRSGKPLLLVESDRINDERVALPPADGMAEERRPQIVTRWMWAAVQVDDTPRVRPGDVQQKDALQLRGVDNLKPGSVEESRPAGRFAPDKRRIQVGGGRAVLVERARPVLKRNICGARKPAQSRADLPVPFLIL